jgi:hypothetical protein
MKLKVLHVFVSPANDGQHVYRRYFDIKRHIIIVNFVIMQVYLTSCYFLPLRSTYSPQQLRIPQSTL